MREYPSTGLEATTGRLWWGACWRGEGPVFVLLVGADWERLLWLALVWPWQVCDVGRSVVWVSLVWGPALHERQGLGKAKPSGKKKLESERLKGD